MPSGLPRGNCALFSRKGRDLSEVLYLVEEAFDQLALTIDRGVDRALHLTVALGGTVAAPAPRRDQVENRAGVIAPVGHDILRRGLRAQQRPHGGLD